MIYSKLDGTTSKSFKLGKNGPIIRDNQGKLEVKENDGTIRAIGVSDIRFDAIGKDIPTSGAVNEAISKKIRTVTSEVLNYLDVTGDIKEEDYIFLEKTEGGN